MRTIVGVITAALLFMSLSAATAVAAPGSCPTASWGSDLKTNYRVTQMGEVQNIGNVSIRAGGEDGVQRIRTGTDACWDRVVIDLAWPEAGTPYHVTYVDEVTQEGSGDVVPVRGGAKLQVSLLSPVSSTFDRKIAVDGYPTLRSVVYTGDFEGLGMGVGVRARLPFRVFTLSDPGRIVIDIAHRWP